MYQKFACKIAEWLLLQKVINREEIEVYQYSIEVLLSDLIYIFIAIITAIVSNSFIESIIFFTSFLTLRKFSGGYHANTYLRCHFLFWANQLIMIILYKLITPEYSRFFSLIIILLGVICIFKLAPVGSVNKPLSESEKRRYRFSSRLIIIFDATIVMILSIIGVYFQYVFIYAFGAFSVSISLVAEKIKYKKGENNYENKSKSNH